jgi:hypothetical protein
VTVQKQQIKHRLAQYVATKMNVIVAALSVLVHEIILLLVLPPKWSFIVPVIRSLIFLCVLGAFPLLLPYVETFCESAPDVEALSFVCKFYILYPKQQTLSESVASLFCRRGRRYPNVLDSSAYRLDVGISRSNEAKSADRGRRTR